MVKQKAVVDSCFLQKISAQGKYPDNIKRILDIFGYIPVANKYVAEQELLLHGYLKKLIEEGYITTIEYDEYLKDDFAREIYERQFIDLYNEMRNYLQCGGGRKQMPMLNIPKGKTIYTHHIGGSSMGDIHMILMASYMRVPIFLSEDSDIELLKSIAGRRLSSSLYHLNIVDTRSLLKEIAQKPNVGLTHKEFEVIVKQVGERSSWATINAIWNDNHR